MARRLSLGLVLTSLPALALMGWLAPAASSLDVWDGEAAKGIEASDTIRVALITEPGRLAPSQTEPGWVRRLVGQIQRRLAEIGIYYGPANGELDPATTRAIRAYQRAVGLPEDGKPSEALLVHLVSAAGDTQKLLLGLEAERQKQIETAERALTEEFGDQWAVPRDRETASQTEGSPQACLADPSPECLIGEALDAADRIAKADFRDWALGEIAIANVMTGDPEGAYGTARTIGDPRSVIATLGDIALALVESGKLDEALSAAAHIPDESVRADVLSEIATSQANNGDPDSARETALAIADPGRRIPALNAIALAHFKAGEVDAAQGALSGALSIALRLDSKKARDRALSEIALVQFKLGKPALALETVEGLSDPVSQVRALSEMAAFLVENDQAAGLGAVMARALEAVEVVSDATERNQALSRLAVAHAETGRFQTALETANTIQYGYSYAYTIALIALAQAEAGDGEGALALASGVTDGRLKVQTLWAIAAAQARAGDDDAAEGTRAKAFDAARTIVNTMDRLFVLCDLASSQALWGDRAGARETIAEVLKVAWPIENAWARARILSKAAISLSVLLAP